MVEPILGQKKTSGVKINFSYLLIVLIIFSRKENKKKHLLGSILVTLNYDGDHFWLPPTIAPIFHGLPIS